MIIPYISLSLLDRQFEPEEQVIGEHNIIVTPHYIQMLQEATETALCIYHYSETLANYITYCELKEISKFEMRIFRKNGSIEEPNSLEEILKNIEDVIAVGCDLYLESNDERILNVTVGLEQVKDVIKNIKDLKMEEHNFIASMFN